MFLAVFVMILADEITAASDQKIVKIQLVWVTFTIWVTSSCNACVKTY